MKKNPRLAAFLIASSFFLGLSFNFFYMWRIPGLSVSLYFLLSVGVFQLAKYFRNKEFSVDKVEYLFIPLFLVSLVPALTQNYVMSTLSILILLLSGTYIFLMSVWEIKLINFGYFGMFLYPFFHQMIQIIYVFRPILELRGVKKDSKKVSEGVRIFLKIMAGVVLALPILLCFFILFLSADVAFGEIFAIDLERLWEFLSFERFWEIIVMLIISVWWLAYLSAGFYFKLNNSDSLSEKPKRRVIDPVIASVVSVLLNLLFLCFVIIQFVYLFAGEQNISELGISYATYARQGFFELVLVASLSLVVIFVLRKWGSFRSQANNLVLQMSLLVQVLFTLIILVSSYYRMTLYQNAYGFTDTRFFVFIFLVYLAIVFVLLGIAVLSDKVLNYYTLATFAIGTTIFFFAGLINPDAYVARANIAGYQNNSFLNEDLDKSYLIYELSSDAYSQLLFVDEFSADEDLYCTIARKWVSEWDYRSSLQELNFYRAGNIQRVEERLADYLNEDREVVDSCSSKFINRNYRW